MVMSLWPRFLANPVGLLIERVSRMLYIVVKMVAVAHRNALSHTISLNGGARAGLAGRTAGIDKRPWGTRFIDNTRSMASYRPTQPPLAGVIHNSTTSSQQQAPSNAYDLRASVGPVRRQRVQLTFTFQTNEPKKTAIRPGPTSATDWRR